MWENIKKEPAGNILKKTLKFLVASFGNICSLLYFVIKSKPLTRGHQTDY